MERRGRPVNIHIFLDGQGRVRQIPVPNRTKLPVLAYLSGKFDAGRTYTEKEVNAILTQWHTFDDYFLLRRLLVDYGLLDRTPNGAAYWVAEKQEDPIGQEKGTEAAV